MRALIRTRQEFILPALKRLKQHTGGKHNFPWGSFVRITALTESRFAATAWNTDNIPLTCFVAGRVDGGLPVDVSAFVAPLTEMVDLASPGWPIEIAWDAKVATMTLWQESHGRVHWRSNIKGMLELPLHNHYAVLNHEPDAVWTDSVTVEIDLPPLKARLGNSKGKGWWLEDAEGHYFDIHHREVVEKLTEKVDCYRVTGERQHMAKFMDWLSWEADDKVLSRSKQEAYLEQRLAQKAERVDQLGIGVIARICEGYTDWHIQRTGWTPLLHDGYLVVTGDMDKNITHVYELGHFTGSRIPDRFLKPEVGLTPEQAEARGKRQFTTITRTAEIAPGYAKWYEDNQEGAPFREGQTVTLNGDGKKIGGKQYWWVQNKVQYYPRRSETLKTKIVKHAALIPEELLLAPGEQPAPAPVPKKKVDLVLKLLSAAPGKAEVYAQARSNAS